MSRDELVPPPRPAGSPAEPLPHHPDEAGDNAGTKVAPKPPSPPEKPVDNPPHVEAHPEISPAPKVSSTPDRKVD